VDRGVFRALSQEEVGKYKGPVNYISMVEAFKTGPHATTPLRICMKSSMKQPKPSRVSLSDCLLKGPLALADLNTVTLGIREHKIAFTKDISSSTSVLRLTSRPSMLGESFGDLGKGKETPPSS
jgi:hypothetical protein